jgi:hypothetical protein
VDVADYISNIEFSDWRWSAKAIVLSSEHSRGLAVEDARVPSKDTARLLGTGLLLHLKDTHLLVGSKSIFVGAIEDEI